MLNSTSTRPTSSGSHNHRHSPCDSFLKYLDTVHDPNLIQLEVDDKNPSREPNFHLERQTMGNTTDLEFKEVEDEDDDRFKANSKRRKKDAGNTAISIDGFVSVKIPSRINTVLLQRKKMILEGNALHTYKLPNNEEPGPVIAVSPTAPTDESSALTPFATEKDVRKITDFLHMDDVELDDLPSASSIATTMGGQYRHSEAERRFPSRKATVKRPNSLVLTFGVVDVEPNGSKKKDEQVPRFIQNLQEHRDSLISKKSTSSNPDSSPLAKEKVSKIGQHMFDACCSIKFILFIFFISTVITTGLSVWLTGYLTTQSLVVGNMAHSSNEMTLKLVRTNWITSIFKLAPYILDMARSSVDGENMVEILQHEIRKEKMRKTFSEMMVNSQFFAELYAVDIVGNINGVDSVMMPNGTRVQQALFNNGSTLLIYDMDSQGRVLGLNNRICSFNNSDHHDAIQALETQYPNDKLLLESNLPLGSNAVWSSVTSKPVTEELVLCCRIPFYTNITLTGYLTIVLPTTSLSTKILEDIELSVNGRFFVLQIDGSLIATSHGLDRQALFKNLVPAMQANDTIVRSISQHIFSNYGQTSGTTIMLNSTFLPTSMYIEDSEGSGHYVSVLPITRDSVNWLLVLSTAQGTVMTLVNQSTMVVILVSVGLVVVASIISLLISILITRPLGCLKERVDQLANMDFKKSNETALPFTFSEVKSIIISVNRMSFGLESFSKFVPYDIVASIVKSKQGASLGVEWKNITLFFSDIASFTNMTETMSPDILVELMCDFFTQQTDIIMNSKGTIDKFIGGMYFKNNN